MEEVITIIASLRLPSAVLRRFVSFARFSTRSLNLPDSFNLYELEYDKEGKRREDSVLERDWKHERIGRELTLVIAPA